jgi:ABC-type transporter Mla subunit MlaD
VGLTAASGCGGDGDDAPTTAATSAPSRAAFIAQADAVCRRTNERIAATNARITQINRTATSESGALADAAPLLAETHRTQQASLAELRELAPPAGDEQTVDEIVRGLEQQVATVGSVAEAARAGDAARVRSLGSELQDVRSRAAALLRGYGFRVCGRG